MTLNFSHFKPVFWKWSRIDCDDLKFPSNFIWGVSTSSHQVEGNCDNNNWFRWENIERPPDQDPTIKDNQKSGLACDHWNRIEEDTELIKQLGVDSYRFSLEWSKIEPEKGKYDSEAILHYHKEIDHLLANQIQPMITLFHFSYPIWFEDLGAFEKIENSEHFIRFSKNMFEEYGEKVKLWCTVNEPEVFVSNAYVTGLFPPGKLGKMHLAGTVIKNLLHCHVEIYQTFKIISEEKKLDVKVGIVKDLFQFHPYKWHNLFDYFLAWECDHLFNAQIIKFFKTGKFHFWVPFAAYVSMEDKRAKSSNDFIGLNYYSHYYVNMFNLLTNQIMEEKLLAKPREIMTDMPHPSYPEGIYYALMTLSKLKIPIIVTENGISDKYDDRRKMYIRRYIYAMSKAIKDGANVVGYYYWSLMDNFEWIEGYHQCFGLYKVDFDTQKRTLRNGSKAFISIVSKHKRGLIVSDSSQPVESEKKSKGRAVGDLPEENSEKFLVEMQKLSLS
eukprot:CAMPEP_0171455450 /NCGR_PEP_ID=MMETSP0945-20130129/2341_1 /TAXON_ID=109269 /ORGANISM="Vaucheria litorea, Strain CCMP2940" /LENGTH=498 /DNA_ID=CAMNT_0011980695 /DNA_START=92 /DNA_END=1588 /DNA_ORIENTATION=-